MAHDEFLELARNLARYHREHEKFYSRRPLEAAVGILFMEGHGEPAEIGRVKGELRSASEENEQASEWLGAAMETSWGVAETLLRYPELADLVSERHRIIANNWEFASLAKLVARDLDRARAILERIDFSPAALRRDLEGAGIAPVLLHSACDLIDHASDLQARSATLVHENERRWRVFRERLDQLLEAEG